MRLLLIAALLLAGCGKTERPPVAAVAPVAPVPREVGHAAAAAAQQWEVQASGDGTALIFGGKPGDSELRFFCPAGTGTLQLNVPGFDPIGSEERLSFGQGGAAEALIADPSGDPSRGGVTAVGPVPTNLVMLLSGRVVASYGAQVSGPHSTPPPELVDAFAAACRPRVAVAPVAVSPCLTQDGRAIPANTLRVVATEPFWGAQVEGRCVTYSHPENQAGTRVWTKFSGTASNGTWSGALDGKPFVLRTRPQSDCSDGMSDTRYPIAASLTVGGEQRNGCAR
ncbi:MAG: hypothetical protein ABIR05_01050 [Luteimonas sp.]